MSLHHDLESILIQVAQSGLVAGAGIEPGLADTLLKEVSKTVDQHEQLGIPAVLLVPDSIRLLLARFLRRSLPQLKVISHSEVVDSRKIKFVSIVGGNK